MTVIGIDFGTTTCSVARWDGEIESEPQILSIDEASDIDPHIMRTKAKIRNGRELHNFKLDADRSGRGEVFLRRIETAREKREYMFDQMAQCLVPLNNDTEYYLEVKRAPISCKGGENYLEEELAEGLEVLFSELYQRAEGYTAAEKIVVGLPLSYLEIGRERIINSLQKAGWAAKLEQIILFPEPLAIALRCGLDYKSTGNQRIMVADHGGGTLDMCIFELEAKDGDFHIKVLSQKRCDIAGNLFDQYLMHWISEKEPRLYPGYKVASAPMINDYPLWNAVEQCKIRLSDYNQATIDHPCRFGQLKMTITRTDLEDAIKDGLDYIQKQIKELLAEVEDDSVPINKVFLAGGSARMPCVQQLFKKTIATAGVIADYTGSGVLAQSLALVPQYQDFIERLCENTYGVWDYKNKTIITLVKAGTLVTPKTDLIKAPRVKINIEQSGKSAPLIMFHQQGGQWEPLYQMEIENAPIGLIDIIPKLDTANGSMKAVLKANDIEIMTQLLYYADLKEQAPPVVCKGQIARIGRVPVNYYIDDIKDVATGDLGIEMAVGKLEHYRLYLHQYRIIGELQKRLKFNQQLSILKMGPLAGFEAVSLNSLIENNSFIPLLDIEGNEFSLIIPTEIEEVEISEEQILQDEAAATEDDKVCSEEMEINEEQIHVAIEDFKVCSKSPLDEVKTALTGLISEELDNAWEKGRIDMKRELIAKYIMIKTKEKKNEEEKIHRLTEAWSDQELDSLVDKAFRLSAPGEILDLLERKHRSIIKTRNPLNALLKKIRG